MFDRFGLPEPQCHPTAFIAPGAVVLGNVSLGEASSVWFGAVVRGDTEAIHIGSRTNIQDGCILHADPGFPCTLGDGVTLGHGAIVHGASLADNVLIGMRAVVLNGARLGADCIIGAGAVVTEGTEIPAGVLALGMPAKVVRDLSPQEIERSRQTAAHYVERARQYQAGRAHASSSGGEPKSGDPN